MRVLIATSKFPPTKEIGEEVFKQIREQGRELGVEAGPFLWCDGPGCTNLVFDITGGTDEAQEKLACQVTMALMPSRWTTTKDELPKEDTIQCTT